jgi:hypothetical protein
MSRHVASSSPKSPKYASPWRADAERWPGAARRGRLNRDPVTDLTVVVPPVDGLDRVVIATMFAALIRLPIKNADDAAHLDEQHVPRSRPQPGSIKRTRALDACPKGQEFGL